MAASPGRRSSDRARLFFSSSFLQVLRRNHVGGLPHKNVLFGGGAPSSDNSGTLDILNFILFQHCFALAARRRCISALTTHKVCAESALKSNHLAFIKSSQMTKNE